MESMAIYSNVQKRTHLQKKSVVNWDPVDKTVLANEQVIDGKGWRTGAEIQKRNSMYFMRITKFADDLINDINKLTNWPDKVKAMQLNWIGKSEGPTVSFPYDILESKGTLNVFTTRVDTIYGVTFYHIPLTIWRIKSQRFPKK